LRGGRISIFRRWIAGVHPRGEVTMVIDAEFEAPITLGGEMIPFVYYAIDAASQWKAGLS
jgi:hypothetical protein